MKKEQLKEQAVEWLMDARSYQEVINLETFEALKKFITLNEYQPSELKEATKRFNECKKAYEAAIKDFKTFELFEEYMEENWNL